MVEFADSAGQTLILGAGLAGLGCALEHDRQGARYRVWEATGRVGGLAVSEEREGFTFDATGHWMHLRDPDIRALIEDTLGDDAVWVERTAAIWSHGRLVPYPFQTNTWALPSEVTHECLMAFIDARWGERGRALREREPRTFREFVQRNLGEGIGRHFMYPYNEKLWTIDLDELSPDWMGRFVPNPKPDEVVRGAIGPPDASSGYNARFVYPRTGGIGLLTSRLGERVKGPIDFERRVVEIDPAARVARAADGTEISWTHLVSTLPLPELVGICIDAPEPVHAAARGLRATSVTYVNVAVRVGENTEPLLTHWVYFPESKYPFYRAGCASAAVPSLAPDGCRSFYVEFSHQGDLELDAPTLAIDGLRECELIRDEDEVLFAFDRTIRCAYVIFDHDHSARRQTVFDWLESVGIESVGRYGRWEYSSMEDALLGGQGAARRVLGVPA